MIQYTTPTITMRIKNVALSQTDVVRLTLQPWSKDAKAPRGEATTIASPSVEVDGDDSLVSVKLTQEQSAALPVGQVMMQTNWKSTDGTRGATKRVPFSVESNLLSEVM